MTLHRLGKELASLKDELASAAGGNVAEAMSASRQTIDEAVKMLGGVVDDIEQFVEREEESIAGFVANRPLTSIAAAFLAGVAIGFVVRRG